MVTSIYKMLKPLTTSLNLDHSMACTADYGRQALTNESITLSSFSVCYLWHLWTFILELYQRTLPLDISPAGFVFCNSSLIQTNDLSLRSTHIPMDFNYTHTNYLLGILLAPSAQ